ncbi:unnamed protein product [Haemonchus placei]|uniref:DUF4379 domain-containing protein n=1 Tax=Haemonchus placei TaxID=6290 RepID=A0A0N4X3V1_HAEPC|nr:unnamed protein product [Haemonchus placei]
MPIISTYSRKHGVYEWNHSEWREFFFDHVTIEDLDTKNISITAFHHGGAKLGKDLMIGEATVPLREIRELNTKKEVKVIEEIKQAIPKKLGKLYISSCIEKDARRLTINLKKADDLPRWSFLGAPEQCFAGFQFPVFGRMSVGGLAHMSV